MGPNRPAEANVVLPASSSRAGEAPAMRSRRRFEAAVFALAGAIGLGPASSAFAADDLAAQVRILTERLNATTERLNATDNEVRSLRSQLRQFQSKSAKTEQKQKEASSSDNRKERSHRPAAAASRLPYRCVARSADRDGG